jgi:hypothetical protein
MINFIITKTGVVVVDGAHLVNGLTNMAGAEAKYGLYQLDNLAPVAQTYADADTWTGVAQSLDSGNLNDIDTVKAMAVEPHWTRKPHAYRPAIRHRRRRPGRIRTKI